MPASRPFVRPILWTVFVVSTLGVLALFIGGVLGLFNLSDPPEKPESTAWGILVATVTSVITSVSSAIGLFLGWKKHRFDTKRSDLELQKLQLDIERANLEMNKLKSSRKKRK